jgi:riboflavin synthase
MFTGLIEAVGTVAEVTAVDGGNRLRIATTMAGELTPGDSLAVNGVCLTVVSVDARSAEMDVSPTTARITTLGALTPGLLLNLERALSVGARLGGHFVQGHVDATGVMETIVPQGDSHLLTVRYPSVLAAYIVQKGSIAVDGISLTVAALSDHSFSAQIVPFTWQHTNLRGTAVGAAVNLETDMLGKYVVRALETGMWAGRETLRSPKNEAETS